MRTFTLLSFLLLSSAAYAQHTIFPLDTNNVTIDGQLNITEWQNAAMKKIAVNSSDSINVYYKHDNTAMYFAFTGKLQSANVIFPEVLTDGKNKRGSSWTNEQWWFHVSATDCEHEGAYGQYNNCNATQPDWTAGPNFTMSSSVDTVEMRIPFSKANFNPTIDDTMGITFVGASIGSAAPKVWPSGADVNIPNTWAKATFSKFYASVQELHSSRVSIYPNPTKDKLFIKGLKSNDKVSIYDLNGRKVGAIITNNAIHLNNLPTGRYIIKVTGEDYQTSKLFYKQ